MMLFKLNESFDCFLNEIRKEEIEREIEIKLILKSIFNRKI